MHLSQYEHMKEALDRHLPTDRHLDVLELGSATSPGQTQTHRSLFEFIDHSYVGVDVSEGPTVDIVMEEPYTIPAASNSKDVIVCGSVIEHIPFFWASMLEMARVLRPGGRLFVTVPSRGHKHSPIDCWRVYPDGLRAMAAWAHLIMLESHTHYPPFTSEKRHDYPRIDVKNHYWGDSVGVFEKPGEYPFEVQLMQRAVRRWANQASAEGPLGTTPNPRRQCSVLAGGDQPTAAPEGSPVRPNEAKPAAAVQSSGGAGDKAHEAREPVTDRDMRDRVLKATADEFMGHGLSGARLDRIAFRAGLHDKDLISETIGGKDELLAAAVTAGLLRREDVVDTR